MESNWRSSALHERSLSYFSSPQINFSSSSMVSYTAPQYINARAHATEFRFREFAQNQNDVVWVPINRRELEMRIIADEIVPRCYGGSHSSICNDSSNYYGQRSLEEEVRREEREMGMRSVSHGALWSDSRPPSDSRGRFGPTREIDSIGLGRLPFQRDPRVLGAVPFQRDPRVLGGLNMRYPSLIDSQEVNRNALEVDKDKVVILARPSVDSARRKCTATPPSPSRADLGLTSAQSKKHKAKDDWSCVLCHVTVNSERDFNEHLKGKRHKARVTEMISQTGGAPSSHKTIVKTKKLMKASEARPSVDSAKRKRTETPPPPSGADLELTSARSKKHKTKDDWSCILCHVTVNSQRDFNEHLKGKRHNARETEMISQTGGAPSSHETIVKIKKLMKAFGGTKSPHSRSKRNNKLKGKSSLGKVHEIPTEKAQGAEDTLKQDEEKPVVEKENGEAKTTQKTSPTDDQSEKFRFHCEMCGVKTHSQRVLNAHMKGKKHMGKLSRLNQTDKPKPSTQKVVSKDIAGEEIKKEIIVNQTESIEECVVADVPSTEKKEYVGDEVKTEKGI